MKPVTIVFALISAFALSACDEHSDGGSAGMEHGHGHGESGREEEIRKGEHGGRLHVEGDITVELRIAEDGMPPTYQAWLYRAGKPLPPAAGGVEVRLTRLGGVGESHLLVPQQDGSLMAQTVVGEPHSFDVEVLATVEGRNARWAYESYEGRTRIDPTIAEDAGIRVAPAGPAVIADQHEVQGLLTPVEGRVAVATARFPGPIRKLDASVGDKVRAGQLLATIESNLSLSTYTVSAPIDGVVLARNGAPGGMAAEGAVLFEIGDLSQLWVDLHVFGADAGHIVAGSAVTVTRIADGASLETTIERVLPGTATASQSTVARAMLPNHDGLWRPGSAVKARVTVANEAVNLAVPLGALQVFRDWDVVFVRVGDTYEVRPLGLGRRDARMVEVVSGLNASDAVVVEQSYLVKADIEKSGASHDH